MVYEVMTRGQKRYKAMCGARVDCCLILNDYASPEEAADAWNRRFEK